MSNLQSLSVTVHAASNLPEKLGALHKTSPYVIVWLMDDHYKTATVKNSGSEASWEETATFQWDGIRTIYIDLMSKDTCFAKAWVNLPEYFVASGTWKGVLNCNPHGGHTAQPKLLITLVNHSFVGGNVISPPHRGQPMPTPPHHNPHMPHHGAHMPVMPPHQMPVIPPHHQPPCMPPHYQPPEWQGQGAPNFPDHGYPRPGQPSFPDHHPLPGWSG